MSFKPRQYFLVNDAVKRKKKGSVTLTNVTAQVQGSANRQPRKKPKTDSQPHGHNSVPFPDLDLGVTEPQPQVHHAVRPLQI
jgi:hypothetical protein